MPIIMNQNLNNNSNNNKQNSFGNNIFNPNFLNNPPNNTNDIFLQHSRQVHKFPFDIGSNKLQESVPHVRKNDYLPHMNHPLSYMPYNTYNNHYIPKLTSPQEYINQKTQEYISKHPETITMLNKPKKQSLDLKKVTLEEEKSTLKKPMLNPEKLMPIECPICHKTFNRLSSYTNHKNLHTGERPYTCKTCGKSFNASPNLSRHKKIHMRNK